MKDGKNRGLSGVTLLIFILFLFGILWFTNQFDQREREITWEEFEELVDSNDVESYTIRQNKNVPTGRVELQLEEEDGRQVYEGEVICNRAEHEFEIDAATGDFIQWSVDYQD